MLLSNTLLRPRSLPRLDDALDLVGVVVAVRGVDTEPVLRGIAAGLGVRPGLRPVAVRSVAEKRHGVRSHGLHGEHRRVKGVVLIVERSRPDRRVIADNRRVVFSHHVTYAAVRVRLRIGAVDDHFVDGELSGTRTPLAHAFRRFSQRLPQAPRPVGVAPDQPIAFLTIHCSSTSVRYSGHSPSKTSSAGPVRYTSPRPSPSTVS